jgi:signal transduction histidine kinase/streptogramin lyase
MFPLGSTMRWWSWRAALLVIVLAHVSVAYSQQLSFKTYTRGNGLASNYIFSIYQDHQGFMWFGTDRGVTRYDGRTFTNYSVADGLSSNLVYSIFQSHDGAMWFGTYQGGVCRFDGTSFTKLQTGLSDSTVQAITQDAFGRMYFLSSIGLDVLRNGKIRSLRNSFRNSGCMFFRQGSLFVVADRAIYRVIPSNDDAIRAYPVSVTPKSSLEHLTPYIQTALQGTNGEIWLGGSPPIVRLAMGSDAGSIEIKDVLPVDYTRVYSLHEEDDTTVWAGTRTGLYKISNTTIQRFGKSEGVEPEFLQAMFRDREGSLWLGTFGGGVKKLVDHHLLTYTVESGLPSSNVTAIFCDSKDNVWIGGSHFIGKIDERGAVAFTNQEFREVRSFAETRTGGIYVGTFATLFGPLEEFAYRSGIPRKALLVGGGVSSIHIDESGAVWIGSYGVAVQRLQGTNRIVYESQMPSNMVEGIVPGFRSLWFLTRNNGAARLRDDAFEYFSIEQGLPSKEVFCVLEDSASLWFGTGAGLLCCAGSDTVLFNEKSGLHGKSVLWIGRVKNDSAAIWVLTELTLHMIRRGEVESFGTSFVLPNNASITQVQYRESDNSLWVATTAGVVKVDLSTIRQNVIAPLVAVTSMRYDTVEVFSSWQRTGDSVLALHYDQNNVSFSFAGLSFVDEENVLYRYKLVPLEAEWSRPSRERETRYRNLAPGNYSFLVSALNANSVASEQPAVLMFTIYPPVWKTWWFMSLAAVAFAATFGSAIRYLSIRKLRRKVAILEREHELQVERERISRDLHDHVGAQLANIISGLDLVGKYSPPSEQRAKRLLQSLQQDARSSMLQLRETIWAIKTQSMSFEKFSAQVEQYSRRQMEFQEDVELSFTAECTAQYELTPTQVLHCFRIVQEALANAVRHARASAIHIAMHCSDDGRLSISVEDNGVGVRNLSPDELQGNGLLNMKRRAEELGGTFLFARANGAGGMAVKVEIPLTKPARRS